MPDMMSTVMYSLAWKYLDSDRNCMILPLYTTQILWICVDLQLFLTNYYYLGYVIKKRLWLPSSGHLYFKKVLCGARYT